MPCLPETMFGVDVDLLFAYPTAKFVTILDARLGIFKYAMTFLIVCYVGIYQLWFQCSYLELSPVQGAVRFTLQQPTQDSCDPTDAGCKNNFNSVKELDYCSQSDMEYPNGKKYPCTFLENIGAQVVMDKSILITSRITTYDQVYACNSTHTPTCPYIYNETKTTTKYSVDPEYFTVLIDHSVIATAFADVKYASSELEGRLYVAPAHNKLCKEYKKTAYAEVKGDEKWQDDGSDLPCYIAPNVTAQNLDFFSVDVLLRASGTSLDNAVRPPK